MRGQKGVLSYDVTTNIELDSLFKDIDFYSSITCGKSFRNTWRRQCIRCQDLCLWEPQNKGQWFHVEGESLRPWHLRVLHISFPLAPYKHPFDVCMFCNRWKWYVSAEEKITGNKNDLTITNDKESRRNYENDSRSWELPGWRYEAPKKAKVIHFFNWHVYRMRSCLMNREIRFKALPTRKRRRLVLQLVWPQICQYTMSSCTW